MAPFAVADGPPEQAFRTAPRRLGRFGKGRETMKAKLRGILAFGGLSLLVGACGGSEDDDGGDDGVGSVGNTAGSDAGATDGAKGSSGGEDSGSGGAGGDDTGAADGGADDGAGGTFGDDCSPTDECMTDQDCGGGTCEGCVCMADDGGSGATCPSNVSTQNPACDSCIAENCCSQFQTCFGDASVTMETPCLQLNNCIAMNCMTAMDVQSLQECVNTSCADLAGEFNNWVGFNQCAATSCQAQCAG